MKEAERTNKIEIHRQVTSELSDLYEAKNSDYGDSFALTRGKYPNAILIRLTDKLSRLDTLLIGANIKVKDESIDDTLLDLANYALMEYVERKVERQLQKEQEVCCAGGPAVLSYQQNCTNCRWGSTSLFGKCHDCVGLSLWEAKL